MEKFHQHRPQTATTHVSTKVMCNSKFMELSGTLLLRKERRKKKGDKHRNRTSKSMTEHKPFPEKKREKKGDKHRNPSTKRQEPVNQHSTEALS
jgi:hypothetical protein